MMFNFDWPPHWVENVIWASIGCGVGGLMIAPFVGMWMFFNAVWTLIGATGMLLGFRLADRQLDETA